MHGYEFNCCSMLDNYKQAIDYGSELAFYDLGLFYIEFDEGRGIEELLNGNLNNFAEDSMKIYNIGKKYLEKSFELGYSLACLDLASSPLNTSDDTINYYLKGIELNDISSMISLAKVYLFFDKIENMELLYKKAIELFDINAIILLSDYYYKNENDLCKSRELDKLLLKYCSYDEKYRCEYVYEKFKPIELFMYLNEFIGENKSVNFIVEEQIRKLRNTDEINNFYNKVAFAKRFNVVSECIICFNECLVLCFNCAHLCCENCYSKVSVCPLCRK